MHRPINNGIGGAHAACASCKHQRKKCDDKCVLSPYFPVEKSTEFQAVHKVYGVSNVTKMVLGVCEEDRRRLADSLVWEARLRAAGPGPRRIRGVPKDTKRTPILQELVPEASDPIATLARGAKQEKPWHSAKLWWVEQQVHECDGMRPQDEHEYRREFRRRSCSWYGHE
ncbi:hypothetical protein NL676_000949 [Syzygium grande]|nr:hypothetical protein NL676_000949 [Syzygium grande]